MSELVLFDEKGGKPNQIRPSPCYELFVPRFVFAFDPICFSTAPSQGLQRCYLIPNFIVEQFSV